MSQHSPVLLKLAEFYEKSTAGRHGDSKLAFRTDFEQLLRAAGCAEGEQRELAERELYAARDANLIQMVYDGVRAHTTVLSVRLPIENESKLFSRVGRPSPTEQRQAWVTLFTEAASWLVPAKYAERWRDFCVRRVEAVSHGRMIKPFRRGHPQRAQEILKLVVALLAWEGSELVRWVSSILSGDSKMLERRQTVLEALLNEVTVGAVCRLTDLGIQPVPPGVTFQGPIRLRFAEDWLDLSGLYGPATLCGSDVQRITGAECESSRCLTVENATPFRSLAALGSGVLLIQTSYPNEATLGLLSRLAEHLPNMEFWHFGDTDPAGFHILYDLRARSNLPFRAFHMQFRPRPGALPLSFRERELLADLLPRMPMERPSLEAMLAHGGKGDFEQESLKPPALHRWPFYTELADEG